MIYLRDRSWAPHEVYLAEGVGEGLAEESKRAALRAQAGEALELSLQAPGGGGRVSSSVGFAF